MSTIIVTTVTKMIVDFFIIKNLFTDATIRGIINIEFKKKASDYNVVRIS